MTIQNFDSLFAVNVRAPYFSSSSSCEPRLGSPVFLTLAAAHAAVTNLSVYAATKGAVETLSGICLHPLPARLRCVERHRVPPPGNSRILQTTGGRAGGDAPPARSPAMRFATNYETRSRGVGGSHPEERHFGARLASSVAKTASPQDAALYSFGATFPGRCCERNSIPAR
jgi:hypothetical protein